MDRVWKETLLTSCYEVSNYGEVRNKKTKKLLQGELDKDGYRHVCLRKGLEKHKTPSVHKLVAQAFIPNPNNFTCINHKDENKLNNNVENLEWCTIAYNNKYGNHNKKCKIANQINNGKRVKAIKDGKEYYFISVKEAGRKLGLNYTNIFNCLAGRLKTTGGYKFEEVLQCQ